ncbi:MAG: M48 family metallopeptidase [Verrucomicrobia bacterium]|jgi:STE24 endopeptidase|nr:M48 family metallopeptidase [Verrucomicrobiota bacterium]
MNTLLMIIVAILVARFGVELVADILNLRCISEKLPSEFDAWYDRRQYEKSQRYLRETTRFGILTDGVQSTASLVFILAGGFAWLDHLVRAAEQGDLVTGLLFMGSLFAASQLLSLPFSIYSTFVLEARYGFNRTTPRTFILDIVKGLLLTALLGGPLLALMLWFFEKTGAMAWLWCWGSVTTIQIILLFLAPYVIMPLFNKFTPLEAGALRDAVEGYATEQAFAMKGVYTMDGSRRSAKSNAFFTGFGNSRRIVLFDTLVQKHPDPELLAIVAHEMGHYKRHHIIKAILRGIATTGATFFLLSLCIKSPTLFAAFRMEHLSIHASFVFFGFLYTPVSMALGIVGAIISRRHEYEADAFAVETAGDSTSLIAGLKRLTVENLGNLSPHPFKVWLDYSHPPVMDRIKAIRKLG